MIIKVPLSIKVSEFLLRVLCITSTNLYKSLRSSLHALYLKDL